jgi:ATP-dependent Clp endopeptidase proteolytic subunit ClpP
MKKRWFEMRAGAQQAAEIAIYDDIGAYGVSARDFIAELRTLAAPVIHLSINSPGGSVFDALAMYNALRQHPADILVDVLGVAASAASLVAMAGDKIIMPDNAFMMVHNPWGATAGNAEELRGMADTLDKIAASLIAIYAGRTGKTDDEIKALLDAETWLSAEEAVAHGFADELRPAMPIAARFELERMPEAVRNVWAQSTPAPVPMAAAPQPVPAVDFKAVESWLLAHAECNGIRLAAGFPLVSDVHAEIVAVCQAARVPELADRAIMARVPLAALRHMLTQYRAAQDATIDVNHHIPAGADGSLASQVWNARRGQA